MNKSDQKPPVVVVTGASAGVGRAIVRRFAKDKAKIGLIARGHDGLEGARREVEEAGGAALVCPCDVSDYDALDAAASQIEALFGPIDIWVNVAFAGVFSRFIDMDMKDYHRVTDVTYHGQVHGTHVALKRMLPRDKGSIVLVGSALAYRGIPLQSAYCGAKHAIQGFQDSVRSELINAGSNVHLGMVHLPGVNTPQFDWIRTNMPGKPKPASPPYQPEIPAEAVHFMAKTKRKAMKLGWPTWEAVMGDYVASPLLDRYLADTAVSGQQAAEPVSPDRRDNLWEPVPGDHGAHGRFDRTARTFSSQLWLSKNRNPILAGAATLAAGSLGLLFSRLRPT